MRILSIMLIAVFAKHIKVNCQTLEGRWRSSDSTRVYYVYRNNDELEAVVEKSTRSNEKSGALVLSLIQKKGNFRYKGVIHSVDGQISTLATIKFKTDDVLILRLRRFFIPVKIKWYKVSQME